MQRLEVSGAVRPIYGSLGVERLTVMHSAFCPHNVFVCSVWISEQTAIISLHSVNCLVFVTETGCVYCAVSVWNFYMFQVYLSLKW